ncbi:MAG: adenosylcobinamide-GDP ribazoletransferase [Geobacteraceae bacterium]|nr:adenosylcobinamide-GDP ribazoletransferase [Geobacteraceae bacterium]
MRLFFTAFQFLTIIPLPFRVTYKDGDMGRSMRWFPLVGLVLGALICGVDRLFGLILPQPLVAALLVAILAAVTGALHLDGLADVFDGFGARGDRERFLAVMKDSSTGAIGAVALVLALLLKYEAIVSLPAASRLGAIILFPAIARLSQVLMTVGSRRARSDGLGAHFVSTAGNLEVFIATLTLFAAAWFLSGVAGIIASLLVALFTGLSRWYFHHHLGGITGDIIGCISELGEIVALLAIISCNGRF